MISGTAARSASTASALMEISADGAAAAASEEEEEDDDDNA